MHVTDHYHAYKFCMKYFYKTVVTNVAMVQIFEVVSNTFNVDKIFT